MKMTKMHGCGNDYVYIDGAKEQVLDKPAFVQAVSDRHFGVGGDGAIFINPSDVADFEMEMYNADGSRAQMCGNGIRCVAKYVYDKGLTDQTSISVVSAGAIKYLDLTVEDGQVASVKVNMGAPILEAARVPVDVSKAAAADDAGAASATETEMPTDTPSASDCVLDFPLVVDGTTYHITCVSMGNPHAVVFVDDVANFPLEKVGPLFEHHPIFPERTNTEFVQVMDPTHVSMRVWERGTGETLACGTGACATTVACVLNGLTEDAIEVALLGGKLQVRWDREDDLVYMTGPATTVCEIEYPWAE